MSKDTLQRLASEINNSDKLEKKQRSWVNGQFGLGAHAFRLFAQKLTVISKKVDGDVATISIEKDLSDATLFDGYPITHILLLDEKEQKIKSSGTIVEVGNIDTTQLRNLTVDQLRDDIEKHFEMLLKRNVSITIIDGINQVRCEPFDYDSIEGIPIKEIINSWQERGTPTRVLDGQEIILNLKVCKQPENRPVYITSKGRRIAEVKEMKSFNDYIRRYNVKQGNAWTNPLLTGYIDVKRHLNPTVHRNDFESTWKRTAIYAEIMNFNEKIFEAIQREMRNKTDEGMKTLGSKLTDILSRLAREDSMNLRKIDETGNEQAKIPQDTMFDPDENGDETFVEPGGDNNSSDPIDVPGGRTIETRGTANPDGSHSGIPNQPKKRGMQIELYSFGAEERASYSDGVIYIYTEHPDFQDRVQKTRGGELASMKITARLANYLAAIIASKYKEQFYQQKKLEPERDKVLDEQIDFIFRFENLMQDFIDQRLDKIGEIA
jgi:hypothetical protein